MKVRDAIAVLAGHDLDEEVSALFYFPDDIVRIFGEAGYRLSKKTINAVLYDIGFSSGEAFIDTINKWRGQLAAQREQLPSA